MWKSTIYYWKLKHGQVIKTKKADILAHTACCFDHSSLASSKLNCVSAARLSAAEAWALNTLTLSSAIFARCLWTEASLPFLSPSFLTTSILASAALAFSWAVFNLTSTSRTHEPAGFCDNVTSIVFEFLKSDKAERPDDTEDVTGIFNVSVAFSNISRFENCTSRSS